MKTSIALIFAASTLFLAGCCTNRHAAEWEYRTVVLGGSVNDTQVNALGKDGWQIISYTYQPADATTVQESRYLLRRTKTH